MTRLPPLIEALLEVARALDELELPYLVGGSLASSTYGEARTTQDVDVLVDLDADALEPLLHRLGSAFYADDERARRAIESGSSFNAIHLATMSKIDLFIAGEEPMNRNQLDRRRFIELPDLPGVTLPIASPEDVIVQKLRWYRLGSEVSGRQWRDAENVVRVQRDALDREYLSEAARKAGVEDLLNRLVPQL